MSTTKNIEKIPYKGSFSYKNDDINSIDIDKKTKIIIENLHGDIAKLYFVNNQNVHIPIPANIVFKNVTCNQNQISTDNNFYVVWFSDYTMYKKDKVIFSLENQKKHIIRAATAVIRKVIRK
ncbi:hypothetical protein Glove_373g2 [Diversispora epigaea]|uniref:Uncharacterized protein n=1 Tax=Diversispora epigaea TaxID=1348612 RepID=A0A397H982_9GLOM|nr:hypothetical protein Glove_373g2 [Diversispora epigaea]